MKRLILVSICYIILCISYYNAQPQTYDPTDNLLNTASSARYYDSTELDSAIIEVMETYNIPGVAASIIKNDKIIWIGTYGYADIENGRAIADTTLFLLASLSKMLTGTAIMQLWENGLFDLDDNINDYLPFDVINPIYPEEPITFRMLLTHTSTIAENWDVIYPMKTWGTDSPITLDEFYPKYLVEGGEYYFQKNYISSSPGTVFHYTNAGFALIGLLVEEISNTSFDDFTQTNIFAPLGMNKTSWFLRNLEVDDIAIPYRNNGSYYSALQHAGWVLYPSAMLRSNIKELSNFLISNMQNGKFNEHNLLDSSTVDLMTTIQNPTVVPMQGLAWRVFELTFNSIGRQMLCGHTGAWDGCATVMGYTLNNPLDRLGVITLTNSESSLGAGLIENILTIHGFLFDKLHAKNVSLNSRYIPFDSDTYIINTTFANPKSHNFTARVIVVDDEKIDVDSTTLYDDGMHNDKLADDGIWGNYLPKIGKENRFSIDVGIIDLDSNNNYFRQNNLTQFTTEGPLKVDSMTLTQAPYNQYLYGLRIWLRNYGNEKTIKDIEVRINSENSTVIGINPVIFNIPSVGPNELVGSSSYSYISMDSTFSEGSISFNYNLSVEDVVYWTDEDSIYIYTVGAEKSEIYPLRYAIQQNYPNPFNPSTKIKYSIPSLSHVSLKIFDVLGREIKTLVNKEQSHGNYEIEFDASNLTSGIYFYRIQAGEFVVTKKMILIK